MRTVINECGTIIDFNFAVQMMDDDIREEVHMALFPCADQEFFDEYVKRHVMKYGEEFEATKLNPRM